MRMRLMCLAICATFLTGCATVLVPPSDVAEPATVYLIDSGRTSSLVIPNEAGALTRYSYGDWDWYALRKTAPWRTIPALLWPTRGALGRMVLAGPVDLEHLSAESQNLYHFQVDRSKALALSRKLDSDFQRNIDTLVHTPSVGLDFVHYGRSYWGFHNSNHAAVGWLHELGVTSRGYPMWSIWKIRPREPQE